MNKNDIYSLLNKNKTTYKINEYRSLYKAEALETLNLPHSNYSKKNFFILYVIF